MNEKVYKVMRGTGTVNIIMGIVNIVIGITSGVMLIVCGGKLLHNKSKILF